LLAAYPDVFESELVQALEAGGANFASFIVDHGLGPLWHERSGRDEFRESRLLAEALYAAQEHALGEIDAALNAAGIEYAVIKGAASRLLLHENPAIRACHDIDLLVRPDERVRTASVLVEAGFTAVSDALNISHELLLSRGIVDIDLHWGMLREGRLRRDCVADMLSRRRREHNTWMLDAEDAFFMLLVHPAFAKHLAAWNMGLHRVADTVTWLRTQPFDWQIVRNRLQQNGVQTAAWTTLRWIKLLTCRSGAPPRPLVTLTKMQTDTQPGPLRRKWLNHWLRSNISERTTNAHWARLLGFSLFLHDTPGDALRAFIGRYRARHRSTSDLAAFSKLFDQ